MMRASYLAIMGCLIGFLSQQREQLEARAIELETRSERHTIARSLHDGYIQALAGVNLRLHTCREMLIRGEAERALAGLTELQLGVTREYDQVRAYIRSLAGIDSSTAAGASSFSGHVISRASTRTSFRVSAQFSADGLVTEHVLQIMIEGMRNAGRHGGARTADIFVSEAGERIMITIKDDGKGFPRDNPPWAIASRVAEIGGRLRIAESDPPGGHLEVEMPRV
jgi:signal transduction histidine kinase